MAQAKVKSTELHIRMSQDLKEKIRRIAERDHRKISQWAEVVLEESVAKDKRKERK